MISIVCVYNDKDILNNFLIKSLKNQTVDYELILMDNRDGKFKSAAEALNEGSIQATGEYLMFAHQDIDLISDKWLEKTEKLLKTLKNPGIIGVAGISPWDEDNKISNIKQGSPPRYISDNRIDAPQKVQTVDECLFIITRDLFNRIKFDEITCDDWHLYAVEYCLSVKSQGYNVYIIPTDIYHASPGYSLSEKYYTTLKKVLNKHKKNYKVVFTTMGGWTSLYPLYIQKSRPLLKKKSLILLEKIYG